MAKLSTPLTHLTHPEVPEVKSSTRKAAVRWHVGGALCGAKGGTWQTRQPELVTCTVCRPSDGVPTTGEYLALALAFVAVGQPTTTFEGKMRSSIGGEPITFVARPDLFIIREAWHGGLDLEDLCDGYGAGGGTNDDWSGIRDSSEEAKAEMLKAAVTFFAKKGRVQ